MLCGWTDIPLTPTGQQEAIRAGLALTGAQVERILCSDLRRAQDTALLIAESAGWSRQASFAPPLSPTPALRERHMGQWEGRCLDDLRREHLTHHLISWSAAPPGGESLRDIAKRALLFLAEQPLVPTLVVAHGGTLRAILGLLDGEPLDEIGQTFIANATPVLRDVTGGTWQRLLRRLAGPPG